MSNVIEQPVISSSRGTYSGDDSDNRAITHGLGRTPTMVMFVDEQGAIALLNYNGAYVTDVTTQAEVTPFNQSQFFVGGGVTHIGNQTGHAYFWSAV